MEKRHRLQSVVGSDTDTQPQLPGIALLWNFCLKASYTILVKMHNSPL